MGFIYYFNRVDFLCTILQFDDLERLGYKGVALGFFEEDVQAAFTTDCECVVNPTTVQYIRALTVVGML